MKLQLLPDDEGFVNLFQRLIENRPSEIMIFQSDANPVKRDVDVYFYFPCDELFHEQPCGFFKWVITLKTSNMVLSDIARLKDNNELTEAEINQVIQMEYSWAFNIIINKLYFNNDDIIEHTRKWLKEYVEELDMSTISITIVDLLDFRKYFAHYEEFHVNPEAQDPYFKAIHSLNKGDEITINGVKYSRQKLDDLIKKIINDRKGNDDNNGNSNWHL